MENEPIHEKTKAECWAEFWDIIGPALVDLHKKGELPASDVALAAA